MTDDCHTKEAHEKTLKEIIKDKKGSQIYEHDRKQAPCPIKWKEAYEKLKKIRKDQQKRVDQENHDKKIEKIRKGNKEDFQKTLPKHKTFEKWEK